MDWSPIVEGGRSVLWNGAWSYAVGDTDWSVMESANYVWLRPPDRQHPRAVREMQRVEGVLELVFGGPGARVPEQVWAALDRVLGGLHPDAAQQLRVNTFDLTEAEQQRLDGLLRDRVGQHAVDAQRRLPVPGTAPSVAGPAVGQPVATAGEPGPTRLEGFERAGSSGRRVEPPGEVRALWAALTGESWRPVQHGANRERVWINRHGQRRPAPQPTPSIFGAERVRLPGGQVVEGTDFGWHQYRGASALDVATVSEHRVLRRYVVETTRNRLEC